MTVPQTAGHPAAVAPLAPRPPVVGMVGAGQLARMTCQAAPDLAIELRVLAGAPDESAAQVCAQASRSRSRSFIGSG